MNIVGRLSHWILSLRRWFRKRLNLHGRYRIGVAVGSMRSKFVILELTGEGRLLRDSWVILHGDREPAEVLEELTERLVESIRNIAGRMSFRDVPVNLAISGKKLLAKKITMPEMSHREMKKALNLRLEAEFPSLMDDMVVGYRIGQRNVEGEGANLEIIATMTQADHLEEMIVPFESAGFINIRCIPSAYIYTTQRKTENPSLLVDIEAKKTGVYIESDEFPYLLREIGIGGDHFTEAITGRFSYDRGVLELESEGAEKFRNKYGISHQLVETDPDAEEAFLHIPDIMQPVVDKLTDEIRRTVAYVSSSLGLRHEGIVLLGGGATLPGLIPYLKTKLGDGVRCADFHHFEVVEDEANTGKAPAHIIGLALAAAMWSGGHGKLVPTAFKLRRILHLEKKAFSYAVILLAGFILCYSTLVRDLLRKYNGDTAMVNYSALMATSVGSSARERSEEKMLLKSRRNTLSIELPEGPNVVTILKEISHLVPDYVTLTGLQIIPREKKTVKEPGVNAWEHTGENEEHEGHASKVFIEGVVSAKPVLLEVYLSRFNRMLAESGLFDNTEVISWQRMEEERANSLTFEMVCELRTVGDGV